MSRYRRRYRGIGRRRMRKWNRYWKRGGRAKSVAYKALALAKKNAKENRPEMKVYDRLQIIDTNLAANVAAEYDILQGITRGNNDITYTGNRIRVKSVFIKGKIEASATTYTNYKLILILDRDKNVGGVSATWEDVYTAQTIHGFRDTDSTKRFKILSTRTGRLIKDEDGTTNDSKIINWYVKMNIPCVLEEDDPDAVCENNIQLMMIADNAISIPATAVLGAIQIRTRFTDA